MNELDELAAAAQRKTETRVRPAPVVDYGSKAFAAVRPSGDAGRFFRAGFFGGLGFICAVLLVYLIVGVLVTAGCALFMSANNPPPPTPQKTLQQILGGR